MKAKILVLAALIIMVACKKDNYTTKPQLKIKEISTEVLRPNNALVFTIEFTDAEGDIQDSIWVQKVEPKCINSNFTARYKIPEFTATKNLKGEFEVCFSYGGTSGCPLIQGPQCAGKNDTCTFKFWARDKAKNMSDTVVSKTIVITRS